MTKSVNDIMLMIYCFVDEFWKTQPVVAQWRHSPPAQPHFSAAEVLTIALWQGVLEVATLKQTQRWVVQNWRAAFPHLPSSQQGRARLHHLHPQVGQLLAAPCGHAPSAARLQLIDSTPMPLCAPIRHGRVRVVRAQGAYFGKTSKGGVFGFKLPLLRHSSGRVLNISLTPGNWDDRDPALAVVQMLDGGVTLGDLGYRGPECATLLAADAARLLITRERAPEHKFVLRQVRQGIETTFSQLGWKFVDRVFSRSWRGLWNTIQLKVLFYNLGHAGVLPV